MRLGVERDNVFPAYEDAWYYLWRERKLPSNVDPFDSRLADRWSGRGCAGCSSAGLEAPVGYALPVGVDERRAGTVALEPLVPARQPLLPDPRRLADRLPAAARFAALGRPGRPCPGCTPPIRPSRCRRCRRARRSATTIPPGTDRGAARRRVAASIATPAARTTSGSDDASPGRDRSVGCRRRPRRGAGAARAQPFESAGFVVRTAISAEPREGRLYVFMPPTATLEDYLDLVAAVEDTAAAMQMPVILEGYEPPRDPRLQVLRVTPDPGVIEVNVHPASSWAELVDMTTHLYDAARETG
jgi:uncharacterized protein (DUF2126 family)